MEPSWSPPIAARYHFDRRRVSADSKKELLAHCGWHTYGHTSSLTFERALFRLPRNYQTWLGFIGAPGGIRTPDPQVRSTKSSQEVTPTYACCFARACKERHWAATVLPALSGSQPRSKPCTVVTRGCALRARTRGSAFRVQASDRLCSSRITGILSDHQ